MIAQNFPIENCQLEFRRKFLSRDVFQRISPYAKAEPGLHFFFFLYFQDFMFYYFNNFAFLAILCHATIKN